MMILPETLGIAGHGLLTILSLVGRIVEEGVLPNYWIHSVYLASSVLYDKERPESEPEFSTSKIISKLKENT